MIELKKLVARIPPHVFWYVKESAAKEKKSIQDWITQLIEQRIKDVAP